MADDLDPKDDPNEDMGPRSPEDISGNADEEEDFEDIDEAESEEDDLES